MGQIFIFKDLQTEAIRVFDGFLSLDFADNGASERRSAQRAVLVAPVKDNRLARVLRGTRCEHKVRGCQDALLVLWQEDAIGLNGLELVLQVDRKVHFDVTLSAKGHRQVQGKGPHRGCVDDGRIRLQS